MLIARSLLALLSLLLTAPSQCFAARNSSLLAALFLLFATRFLFLICHSLLSAFRMFCSLFPGCYSRVIFYFLLSSNSLFAGINSMLFIVNRY